MSSENQSVKEVIPPLSQNEGIFKPSETVHGECPPGVQGPLIKGKDIDSTDVKPTSTSRPDVDEERPSNGRSFPEESRPGLDRYKQSSNHMRPESLIPDHIGGHRPVLNQSPNSCRFPVTPIMQNPQTRALINNIGSGNPNQQMRQPHPNQPRPFSVYPSPSAGHPSQPHLRGDTPRSNNPFQNSSGQSPMQRSYQTGRPYGDLSQQNMMNQAALRPPLNRPPMFPSNLDQCSMLDNYQKGPNMLPVSPNLSNNQYTPSQNANAANQQYRNPTRPFLTPNSNPTLELTSVVGDGSVRAHTSVIADPLKLTSPNPVGNTHGTPENLNVTTDLNRNPRSTTETYLKKPESGGMKPNPEEVDLGGTVPTVQTKPEIGNGGTEKTKTKEEKESGIVRVNVKFFEERDKVKIPLMPKIFLPVSPVSPARSVTFLASDIAKGEMHKDDHYESGVDEAPMIHPNLRRTVAEKPVNIYNKGGKSSIQSGKGITNRSCPPTPTKINSSTARGDFTSSASRSPSKSYKSIFEFSPEEELLFFFNLAKAGYNSYFDRHHESRIDQVSRRKENVSAANGDVNAVKKTPTKLPAPSKRSSSAHGPSTPLKSPGIPKSSPKTPDSPVTPEPLIKKVPMNKIQVGAAPSPNLKAVRSKIGSLANTTHKPGGGNIKIESHKIDFSKAQPRIAAKNDTYAPSGGDKKIQQVKLQWSAKPKVGSLDNAQHKPGGGDKKIECVKLDFKDKAKPKVGSKDNVKHVPGGGTVKIENQKLEFKAQSKIGSLDNVKHKPGGGDVKIFDDKTYLKQISCGSSEGRASGTQSYCDLSIISEVQSVSAPGTPHRGTAIKIKKSTTLGKTKPGIRKTTEVMVVSRSPSIERKDMPKSSSMHEVKLTYAKVASAKHGKLGLDNVGPIEVVNIPAHENAAILKPDDNSVEVKNLISSFEQQINQKGLPIGQDGKNYMTAKPQHHQDHRPSSQINEELCQKISAVKDELDRVKQDKKDETRGEECTERDAPISKYMKNEMAAHEKVSEMWKEVHNIDPDKPSPSKPEGPQPPPPSPTPSLAQRPSFPPQQIQPNMRMRTPYPQQMHSGQRPPNAHQQFNVQRPPQMQMTQRPSFSHNSQQIRTPYTGPQGQRQPELCSVAHPQQQEDPMNKPQLTNGSPTK